MNLENYKLIYLKKYFEFKMQLRGYAAKKYFFIAEVLNQTGISEFHSL